MGKKAARYRRRRRNPSDDPAVRATKEEASDLATSVGAAFGGYAGTRLLSRAATTQLSKKFPGFAKHTGIVAGLLGVAGVYLVTRYWDRVSKYHESATVGAGVALLQGALQTYLPRYGWVVSDLDPKSLPAPNAAASSSDTSDEAFERLLAENDLVAEPIAELGPSPSAASPAATVSDDGGDDLADIIHLNGFRET